MNKEIYAVLEGLLFIVGDEGMTLELCAEVLGISPEVCAQYLSELQETLQDESRGVELVAYGGIYKMISKPFVHNYAERLFTMNKTRTLSQAALETLAIIAYKQPITRVEIEEIRGVGSEMMLRKLIARDLIHETGRAEVAGRPILYEVTSEFLDVFKLISLQELPELPDFSEDEAEQELYD